MDFGPHSRPETRDTPDEREDSPRSGCVHLYTGTGKGKGTAVLGLAARAVSHGLRVFIVQFLRGSPELAWSVLGDHFADLLEVRAMGRDGDVNPGIPDPVDVKWAEDGLALARRSMEKGEWDLVILDGVTQAVSLKLLYLDDLLDLLDRRPLSVELVLTGRPSNPEIVAAADMVTDLSRIKHYADVGVGNRAGIDF